MHRDRLTRILSAGLLGALLALGTLASAAAQPLPEVCGSLANGYGPYDYRKDRGETLRLVESAHFKPEIEGLLRGKIPGSQPGPEIDYVLRAYPNHHRALVATMRLGDRKNSEFPAGMRYSTECWLRRAVAFRPDDTTARMIYTKYLQSRKRDADALTQLALAEDAASDNGFTHYNIGLMYVELKQFDKALAQAHKAIALGFPRETLKEQLVAAGKWTEPPATQAASAPASATQR